MILSIHSNNYSKKQIRINFDLRNSSDLLPPETRTEIWAFKRKLQAVLVDIGSNKPLCAAKENGSNMYFKVRESNLNQIRAEFDDVGSHKLIWVTKTKQE